MATVSDNVSNFIKAFEVVGLSHDEFAENNSKNGEYDDEKYENFD